jgi:hypothetical protein
MVLKKVVNNEEVSEEEEDTLVSLSKYADQLTQNLLTMENDINSGAMTISAVQKTEEAAGESPGNFNTGIGNMETEFQAIPA